MTFNDDQEAVNYLQNRGYTIDKGIIYAVERIPFIQEVHDAISYLIDEWDYDYAVEAPLKGMTKTGIQNIGGPTCSNCIKSFVCVFRKIFLQEVESFVNGTDLLGIIETNQDKIDMSFSLADNLALFCREFKVKEKK